jgi:hypothetical protein
MMKSAAWFVVMLLLIGAWSFFMAMPDLPIWTKLVLGPLGPLCFVGAFFKSVNT